MAAKAKVRTRRNRARVEDTEPKGSTRKTAAHRGDTHVHNGAGIMEVVGQGSELVPVAQYASVTIGPVLIRRQVMDPGMTDDIAAEIADMEGYDDLSDEAKEVFDNYANHLTATQRIVDTVISEDRELVEESVREYNRRKDEEEKGKKK